jgi:hypothetical protein
MSSSPPRHHLPHKLRVAFNFKRADIVIFAGICLGYFVLRYFLGDSPAREAVWDKFDTATKLVTLFFAFLIWIDESDNKWEQSLDKRLYVLFRFKGKPVLRCDHAPLLGDADIRAFSQQIGAQMAGGRNLNFSINVRRAVRNLPDGSGAKASFRAYFTVFDLDEEKPFKPGAETPPNVEGLQKSGRLLYWHTEKDARWRECPVDEPERWPEMAELV